MQKLIICPENNEEPMSETELLKQELEKLSEIRKTLNATLAASNNKNVEIAVNRIDTAISLLIQETTKN